MILVLGVIIIIGGIAFLIRIPISAPKGTTLIVAISIFLFSWLLEGAHTRETLMLSGSLRMVGFIGFFIGLIDLKKQRMVNKSFTKHIPAKTPPRISKPIKFRKPQKQDSQIKSEESDLSDGLNSNGDIYR